MEKRIKIGKTWVSWRKFWYTNSLWKLQVKEQNLIFRFYLSWTKNLSAKWKSLPLLISLVPTKTLTFFGWDSFTQWPAVKTKTGWITAPPHLCTNFHPLKLWISAMKGTVFPLAGDPPIIFPLLDAFDTQIKAKTTTNLNIVEMEKFQASANAFIPKIDVIFFNLENLYKYFSYAGERRNNLHKSNKSFILEAVYARLGSIQWNFLDEMSF